MTPLLFLLALQPHLFWYGTGLKVLEVEGLWRHMSFAWNMMGKRMIEDNAMLSMAIRPYQQQIDVLLATPIPELWQMYFIPPLQIFCLFPMCILVSPVAVAIFRRDTETEALRFLTLNGGSTLRLLLAKLLAAVLIFLPHQLGLLFASLSWFQSWTGHPELFAFGDHMWLWSWLGAGFALGLWSLLATWLTCLLSRNGGTEIYSSSVAGSLGLMLCLYAVKLMGWSFDTVFTITLILWVSMPLMLLVIWLRLRAKCFSLR